MDRAGGQAQPPAGGHHRGGTVSVRPYAEIYAASLKIWFGGEFGYACVLEPATGEVHEVALKDAPRWFMWRCMDERNRRRPDAPDQPPKRDGSNPGRRLPDRGGRAPLDGEAREQDVVRHGQLREEQEAVPPRHDPASQTRADAGSQEWKRARLQASKPQVRDPGPESA